MGDDRRRAAPDRPAVVHKVLNNNVVIRVDAAGGEQVLMGRGLGFGLKPSDPIDAAKVEKTFVLAGDVDSRQVHELLTDVPYEVIDAVASAIDEAERSLGRALGRQLPVAVIDHVQFLLQRLREGVVIPMAAMPELAVLHPEEHAAALRMVAVIGNRLGVELPPGEAVFLSMHLLNATRDEPNGTAALLLRRVQHVVATVERELGVRLDVSSADAARFILHVKFLLQRLVSKTMLENADSSFYDFARRSYERSHGIAEQVRDYVRVATGGELTDEEMLYLTVHVERLAQHTAPLPPA